MLTNVSSQQRPYSSENHYNDLFDLPDIPDSGPSRTNVTMVPNKSAYAKPLEVGIIKKNPQIITVDPPHGSDLTRLETAAAGKDRKQRARKVPRKPDHIIVEPDNNAEYWPDISADDAADAPSAKALESDLEQSVADSTSDRVKSTRSFFGNDPIELKDVFGWPIPSEWSQAMEEEQRVSGAKVENTDRIDFSRSEFAGVPASLQPESADADAHQPLSSSNTDSHLQPVYTATTSTVQSESAANNASRKSFSDVAPAKLRPDPTPAQSNPQSKSFNLHRKSSTKAKKPSFITKIYSKTTL